MFNEFDEKNFSIVERQLQTKIIKTQIHIQLIVKKKVLTIATTNKHKYNYKKNEISFRFFVFLDIIRIVVFQIVIIINIVVNLKNQFFYIINVILVSFVNHISFVFKTRFVASINIIKAFNV